MHVTKIKIKICSISANTAFLSSPDSNLGIVTEGHARRPTMSRYDSHLVIETSAARKQRRDCNELIFIVTSQKASDIRKKSIDEELKCLGICKRGKLVSCACLAVFSLYLFCLGLRFI